MLRFGQKLMKKKSPNKMNIMLRCTKSNRIVYKEEGEEEYSWKEPLIYDCFDFYVVDLNDDCDELVLKRYCPPLLDDPTGPGDLICLGSFIYSIPLLFYCAYENIPPSLPYPNTGELVDRLTQMFFTTFDNAKNPKKWTPTSFVVPEDFHCAALSGVIYGLESGRLNNALCFEPSQNSWCASKAPPPSFLHESQVTRRMIPDPIKDRILGHLVGGTLNQPSLYAWHPKIVDDENESWKFVQPFNSDLWYGGSTLVNIGNRSLLFFFFRDMKELFKVWSVDDNKFLDIFWCNEIPRLEFKVVRAHSMCYLGKNQLCLALSFPPVEYNDVPVIFLIFDIKQLSKSDFKSKGKELAIYNKGKELAIKSKGKELAIYSKGKEPAVKSIWKELAVKGKWKELGIKSKGKEPAGDASVDDIITFTYVASKSFQASDTKRLIDITCLGEVYFGSVDDQEKV